MSAVALPFELPQSFGLRPTSHWQNSIDSPYSGSPGMESNLSSLDQSTDTSAASPSSTSSVYSPMRPSLSQEHHDLKRQQNRARRDSRLVSRLKRHGSSPYHDGPGQGLVESGPGLNMPMYTSPPGSIAMLTSTTQPPPSQHYLPAFTSQPPSAPPSYSSSSYQQQPLPPSYTLGVSYHQNYSVSNGYSGYKHESLSAPHVSGNNLMYPLHAPVPSSNPAHSEGGNVKVVQGRQKPRCWDHGCNGRQFSTFSNLLRHQREKSGQAAKATCPNCGAEFTRTTARNGHLLYDKCKQRQTS